jgi:hypothetical protein
LQQLGAAGDFRQNSATRQEIGKVPLFIAIASHEPGEFARTAQEFSVSSPPTPAV